MNDIRNENYKMLNKCLDEMAFLSIDQDFTTNSDNLKYFDKFYFELEKKEQAKKDVENKLYNLEHKIIYDDLVMDDFEERNLISEIDAYYGFKEYFKDTIHK